MVALASPALAQSQNYPLARYGDQNNVNLVDGTYLLHEPGVSIGQPASGGLSFSRDFANGYWRPSFTGFAYEANGVATISVDGVTVQFTGSGPYAPVVADGSSLTKTMNYAMTPGGYAFYYPTYTYTNRDGVVYTLGGEVVSLYPSPSATTYLSSIAYPSGETVGVNYDVQQSLDGTYHYRVSSVNSTTGYALNYSYVDNTENSPGSTNWLTIASVTAVNTACDPSVCTGPWPTVTYTTSQMPASNGGIEYDNTTMDPLGNTTKYTLVTQQGGSGVASLAIQPPASGASSITVYFDGSSRVTSLNNGSSTWSYRYTTGTAANGDPTLVTTMTDPFNNTRVVTADGYTDLPLFDQDERHNTSPTDYTTSYTYNAGNQLVQVTHPENDSERYSYDGRGNQIEADKYDKTGANPITLSKACYPGGGCFGGTPSNACSEPGFTITIINCNKPLWTQDGAGNQTNYSWDPTHGGLLVQTSPAGDNGVHPQTRLSYSQITIAPVYGSSTTAAIWRLTGTSTCRTTAATGSSPACAGGASDETSSTISYGGSKTAQPTSVTIPSGDGTLVATTKLTYDPYDNVQTVTNPVNAVTTYYYNLARQKVGELDPDENGDGNPAAAKISYTPDGLVQEVDIGTAANGNWVSGFTVSESLVTHYDAEDRKSQEQVSGGGLQTLTQYNYDDLNRVNCTAVRMNTQTYSSLPDACTQTTAGPDGPDRISQLGYDAVGHVLSITEGVGTSATSGQGTSPLPITYDTIAYGVDGEKVSEQDANGNVTHYTYDNYNRLYQVNYPNPTGGGYNLNDYEQYSYDNAGNLKTRRLRDGQTLTLQYDALNRLTTALNGASIGYDNLGNVTSAALNGQTVSAVYDTLGRKYQEKGPLGTFTFGYDLAGGRTSIQWPDGFTVTYNRGIDEQVTSVVDTTNSVTLASYTYYDLGQPKSVTRGNGVVTNYGFDGLSRLNSLAHSLTNSVQNQSWTFGYNAAGQINSNSASNPIYDWIPSEDATRYYCSNGLNQTVSTGSTGGACPSGVHAFGYGDGRGNMTSDQLGSVTTNYSYSEVNQLTTATGGASATLTYDPLGRLYQVSGSATTQYTYDGDQLLAEYNGPTLLRRYVPGPNGQDDPLVWYEGSGGADRRWLIADQQGSVVGVTNSSGVLIDSIGNTDGNPTNTYNEYGAPANTNTGAFQYTGQRWLPDLDLYYYKARVYSPTLGRFLQTDPIGYQSDINLYAYAGEDPVNRSDPSGLATVLNCPDNSAPDNLGRCPVPTPACPFPYVPDGAGGCTVVTVVGGPCAGNPYCTVVQYTPGPQGIVANNPPPGYQPSQGSVSQLVVPGKPAYCSSLGYKIGNFIDDTVGGGIKLTGAITVVGGGAIAVSTAITGVGAGAGGAVAGVGGVIYSAGIAVSEVGNMVKFMSGQDVGVTTAEALSIPTMRLGPFARVAADQAMSHLTGHAMRNPCG